MSSNVETLCADWLDAKSAETAAQQLRLAIEREIAQAFDVPDEGTKSHKTDNFKVTVGQPVYRSVNADIWEAIKYKLPLDMHPVKTEIKADPAGMKYLANNEPVLWGMVAEAFTTKPGKISVKVEELK